MMGMARKAITIPERSTAIRRVIRVVRANIMYQKTIIRSTITAYVPALDKITRRCRVVVVFCTNLYIV